MTSFDHVRTDPILDTLMQTQYLLFAAALFIGCTIVDAQLGARDPLPAVPATHSAASADDQQLFAEASRLYRAGESAGAYARFATLADRGHPQAARMALAMHKEGLSAAGQHRPASPGQLRAWEHSAADASAQRIAR